MGDEDYVKRAIEADGKVLFGRLDGKPGKTGDSQRYLEEFCRIANNIGSVKLGCSCLRTSRKSWLGVGDDPTFAQTTHPITHVWGCITL